MTETNGNEDRRSRQDPPAWRPVPDPTSLTTEALQREVAVLRELIEVKMDADKVLTDARFTAIDHTFSDRDKRYDERHTSSQTAIQFALAASDKAVIAAFNASKEAILKSETAQEKRNDATFVSIGQMNTSLGNLMPREEAQNRFESQRNENTTRFEESTKAIDDLKIRVAESNAAKEGGKDIIRTIQLYAGLILALLAILGIIGFSTQ